MFIVGMIAKALVARKVSGRAAGPLSWMIVIIGVALLVLGGWQMVKHNVIKSHDAKERAEKAEQQLKRVGTADGVDTALERRDSASDSALKGAINHAVEQDPKRGITAAGPVSNAAADELRRQRGKRQQPATD